MNTFKARMGNIDLDLAKSKKKYCNKYILLKLITIINMTSSGKKIY